MNINGHFKISMIKSVLRLAACIFLYAQQFEMAAVGLAIAEFLGIYEEMV